jgi:hypothetical protein
MSNINNTNTSKRSTSYHLKKDLQSINAILLSNQTISVKCVQMWPHIDNLCVYESFVNPEDESIKKNTSVKINYLNSKMKEFQILNSSNNLEWKNLSQEQVLIIYALFIDIFFGVM